MPLDQAEIASRFTGNAKYLTITGRAREVVNDVERDTRRFCCGRHRGAMPNDGAWDQLSSTGEFPISTAFAPIDSGILDGAAWRMNCTRTSQ
jgi:hypothetical protein